MPTTTIVTEIEETIVEKLRKLPLEKQREALNFVEFLEQKTTVPKPPRRSLTRITVPDMSDRIIAATALYLNLPLVTADHQIQASGIHTIW